MSCDSFESFEFEFEFVYCEFEFIYTVSGKKRPQYSRHNFDNFRHSFVIFGTNHPDTSLYLIQQCNIVTWRWRHIWHHQKWSLQTKVDI